MLYDPTHQGVRREGRGNGSPAGPAGLWVLFFGVATTVVCGYLGDTFSGGRGYLRALAGGAK